MEHIKPGISTYHSDMQIYMSVRMTHTYIIQDIMNIIGPIPFIWQHLQALNSAGDIAIRNISNNIQTFPVHDVVNKYLEIFTQK
jgi:hypothetical protein